MAMGGAFANLGIDSEIGPYSQSQCRNSKWTKNSGSVPAYPALLIGRLPRTKRKPLAMALVSRSIHANPNQNIAQQFTSVNCLVLLRNKSYR